MSQASSTHYDLAGFQQAKSNHYRGGKLDRRLRFSLGCHHLNPVVYKIENVEPVGRIDVHGKRRLEITGSLSMLSDAQEERPFRGKLLDSGVPLIQDIDIALGVEDDVVWITKGKVGVLWLLTAQDSDELQPDSPRLPPGALFFVMDDSDSIDHLDLLGIRLKARD
jgi:hypothetical protein